MTESAAASGKRAESAAAAYLAGKGLLLIEANYRCRFGEIDLVLRDGGTIVFAEVRLRTRSSHGGPAWSIDSRKRRRLVTAARHWLSGKPEAPCRFDVLLLDSLQPLKIEWIQDAFGA